MSVPTKYLMPIVLVISTIGVWSLRLFGGRSRAHRAPPACSASTCA